MFGEVRPVRQADEDFLHQVVDVVAFADALFEIAGQGAAIAPVQMHQEFHRIGRGRRGGHGSSELVCANETSGQTGFRRELRRA